MKEKPNMLQKVLIKLRMDPPTPPEFILSPPPTPQKERAKEWIQTQEFYFIFWNKNQNPCWSKFCWDFPMYGT
jgi:hypothetical protein